MKNTNSNIAFKNLNTLGFIAVSIAIGLQSCKSTYLTPLVQFESLSPRVYAHCDPCQSCAIGPNFCSKNSPTSESSVSCEQNCNNGATGFAGLGWQLTIDDTSVFRGRLCKLKINTNFGAQTADVANVGGVGRSGYDIRLLLKAIRSERVKKIPVKVRFDFAHSGQGSIFGQTPQTDIKIKFIPIVPGSAEIIKSFEITGTASSGSVQAILDNLDYYCEVSIPTYERACNMNNNITRCIGTTQLNVELVVPKMRIN